jgi:hypothetical protein
MTSASAAASPQSRSAPANPASRMLPATKKTIGLILFIPAKIANTFQDSRFFDLLPWKKYIMTFKNIIFGKS